MEPTISQSVDILLYNAVILTMDDKMTLYEQGAIAIRADRIVVAVGNRQVRLRYVNCPFAPVLDTAAQNVFEGL